MKEEVNRIVLKKIYIGSAAMFGLFYGIIIGLVIAVSSVAGVVDISGVSSFIPGGSFASAVALFFISVVFSVIAMVISALIYNIIATFGGNLHFGLVEYTKKGNKKGAKKEVVVSNRPIVLSGGSTSRISSVATTKSKVAPVTKVQANPNIAVVGRRK